MATQLVLAHATGTATAIIQDGYKKLNGRFVNTESQVTIVINLLNNRTYPVAIAAKDKTKGLLITPTGLLANNYTIDITTTDAGVNTLYLNGNRIQKVEFVRMDKP